MSKETSKKTLEVTTPNDREIAMARVFDAPRTLVWNAYTKPELLKRWLGVWGPWSMGVCEIDLRVGGRYRFVWHNDQSGVEFGVSGEYREIAVPSRIVQIERMDGCEGEVKGTLTLSESGGRTTLSVNLEFESQELRDRALESGMTNGMAASYDRLEGQMGAKAA